MRAIGHLPAALLALAAVAAPTLAHAEDEAPRSPEIATLAALVPIGATVALGGAALATDSEALGWAAVTAFVVGPSLGHFYAGEAGRGILTTGARAGGLSLAAVGVLMQIDLCFSYSDDSSSDDRCEKEAAEDDGLGYAMMGAGVGLALAATVYDIVDAAPAARRFNAELSVAPTMVNGAAGNAPGMMISGRF